MAWNRSRSTSRRSAAMPTRASADPMPCSTSPGAACRIIVQTCISNASFRCMRASSSTACVAACADWPSQEPASSTACRRVNSPNPCHRRRASLMHKQRMRCTATCRRCASSWVSGSAGCGCSIFTARARHRPRSTSNCAQPSRRAPPASTCRRATRSGISSRSRSRRAGSPTSSSRMPIPASSMSAAASPPQSPRPCAAGCATGTHSWN